jgi:8-oxo-dGTP pyrophosphatase MutT (NUDIX family)
MHLTMPTTLWPVSVKAVLFDNEGRVLLAKNDRNEWELPGGRLEPGESIEDCVCREIREETGLSCAATAPIRPFVFEVISGRHVVILPFACTVIEWSPLVLSSEHSELRFYALTDLNAIPLPAPYHPAIIEARAHWK